MYLLKKPTHPLKGDVEKELVDEEGGSTDSSEEPENGEFERIMATLEEYVKILSVLTSFGPVFSLQTPFFVLICRDNMYLYLLLPLLLTIKPI
jgi:hypothetical protein